MARRRWIRRFIPQRSPECPNRDHFCNYAAFRRHLLLHGKDYRAPTGRGMRIVVLPPADAARRRQVMRDRQRRRREAVRRRRSLLPRALALLHHFHHHQPSTAYLLL